MTGSVSGTFRKCSLIGGFAEIPRKKLEFPRERFHTQRFLAIIAKSSRLLASARVCSRLFASVREIAKNRWEWNLSLWNPNFFGGISAKPPISEHLRNIPAIFSF